MIFEEVACFSLISSVNDWHSQTTGPKTLLRSQWRRPSTEIITWWRDQVTLWVNKSCAGVSGSSSAASVFGSERQQQRFHQNSTEKIPETFFKQKSLARKKKQDSGYIYVWRFLMKQSVAEQGMEQSGPSSGNKTNTGLLSILSLLFRHRCLKQTNEWKHSVMNQWAC